MPPPRCIICKENFNADTNFPMMLPCNRSLCHACVLRYLEDPSQRCFVCAANHPGVTMDNVHKNHDLLIVSPPSSITMSTSLRAGQSSGMLQLVVMDLPGTKHNLNVCASATVMTVKSLINDMYGIDPETRIMFSGKLLQNNRTLASYGVKTGSTLQLTLAFLGGRVPHMGV